jgi:RHS repeat-associated protein
MNSNRIAGNTGGAPITATYDAHDRLATYNAYTYTYTRNGELQSKTDTATNQTATYTYDVLGNLTQVVLPTKTVSYVVDGLNRRQARVVNGTMRAQYLYEDALRMGAVLNAAGAITHRFIYGAKLNVPDYMIKAGKEYKLISDAVGSVRLVVNSVTGVVAQQLDYDEFGHVLTDTNPGFQPFGFAGCFYDIDTQLCRFGARDYDAQTGRWMSKDPTLFAGGDTNLYGYVLNDPINFTDPLGLSPEDIITIGNTFNNYVNGLVNNGQRLPGTGLLAGAWNNFVSSGERIGQALGFNVTPVQGCVDQSQGLLNTFSQMQSNGQISDDFFFFPGESLTGLYFEHHFMQAVSPKDNIIITLDPWSGTMSTQPIRGGR